MLGQERGLVSLLSSAASLCGVGDPQAWAFLCCFSLGALLLYWWPGITKYGPATPTGYVPDYCDNGIAHCFLSTVMFVGRQTKSTIFSMNMAETHHVGPLLEPIRPNLD